MKKLKHINSEKWDNKNHELLYAFFILKSNHTNWRGIIYQCENKETLSELMELYYNNQWEDRDICQPENKEYLGFISDSGLDWVKKLIDPEFESDEWFPIYIHKEEKKNIKNKILVSVISKNE